MQTFEKFIVATFKLFQYRYIKKKYSLPEDFRFNGYLINIFGEGAIEAGSNCYISFCTRIYLAKSTRVILGDNVSISHNVRIYTESIDAKEFVVSGVKCMRKGDVKIGNNVIIGANVFINPGVVIGDNVVVGANSVITKSLDSFGIYGGVPARMISGHER
jgi:maltose O-acetyltransferase